MAYKRFFPPDSSRYTSTVIGVGSLVVPENEGSVLLDCCCAGPSRVSAGGSVSSVNVTGALVATFPASSLSVAAAVYGPSTRLVEDANDQAPPLAATLFSIATWPPGTLPL